MTIFIDTGIFVAFFNKDDINHKRSKMIMKEIVEKKYGMAFTSDYIIDETLTVILSKTKRYLDAVKAGSFILGEIEDIPHFITLITINNELFNSTWQLYKANKYDKVMSFTDYSSIILNNTYKIDCIASFDSHFDGILPRVH
ncbi:MAG: type II toxin-antitoxin system VapC family toxin [Candidatus Helarchaeota archaeon]